MLPSTKTKAEPLRVVIECFQGGYKESDKLNVKSYLYFDWSCWLAEAKVENRDRYTLSFCWKVHSKTEPIEFNLFQGASSAFLTLSNSSSVEIHHGLQTFRLVIVRAKYFDLTFIFYKVRDS